jgi:hypothetical protein
MKIVLEKRFADDRTTFQAFISARLQEYLDGVDFKGDTASTGTQTSEAVCQRKVEMSYSLQSRNVLF